MTEQDRYGTTKTAQPIPVEPGRSFITSTRNPTAAPDPTALRAYVATVKHDLARRATHDE
jgi:hypothetical protein